MLPHRGILPVGLFATMSPASVGFPPKEKPVNEMRILTSTPEDWLSARRAPCLGVFLDPVTVGMTDSFPQ